MTRRAKYRIDCAKFRTCSKFMDVKFQPELRPFDVQIDLYLAKNNIQVSKRENKTKQKLLWKHILRLLGCHIPLRKKKKRDVLRESQSETH